MSDEDKDRAKTRIENSVKTINERVSALQQIPLDDLSAAEHDDYDGKLQALQAEMTSRNT